MSAPSEWQRLGPGSHLPEWLRTLERACFGKPWAQLGAQEWALLAPRQGFATWSVVPAIGEADLLRIAVAPAARRTGLGRALLAASEAHLRAEGIQTLHLEVRVSNAGARGLYEGEGWREVGRRPGYYADGEDAVLYGKHLG